MKSMKKHLALLMCLLMCLSLFPAGAFAEGEEPAQEDEITEAFAAGNSPSEAPEEVSGENPQDEDALPAAEDSGETAAEIAADDSPAQDAAEASGENPQDEDALPAAEGSDDAEAEDSAADGSSAEDAAEASEEQPLAEEELQMLEASDDDAQDDLRGSGAFDALEAACKDGTEYWEVWSETLTIEQDLTIPTDMWVVMTEGDGQVIVPEGVTLTVCGVFQAHGLKVQGNGRVEVAGSEAVLDLEVWTWNEDLKQKISCSDGGAVVVNERLSSVDQLYHSLDSYSPEGSVMWNFNVSFLCELTRENTVIPGNAALVVRADDAGPGRMIIPERKTLTIEEGGELDIVGSELVFNGNMVNNGSVRIFPDWRREIEPTVTVGDYAVYSGSGQAIYGDQPYTFVSNRTLFDKLKEACNSGTETFFDLSNRGTFVILEDLTIPQDFRMETWGTWIVIPSQVTVTVAENANFEMHNLQVDEGGIVNVRENGFFNCYDDILLNGEIHLGRDADSHFPEEGMDEAARARVYFEGENSRANIHYPVYGDDDLYNAVSQARKLERPFSGNIQICFNWDVSEDFVIEENYGIDINGAWNDAGVTVRAGAKLTVNGYLNSEGGGAIKVQDQGTLENNGWMELRQNDDPGAVHPGIGSIVLDGGSYSGGGTIYVKNLESPESSLVGFPSGQLSEAYRDEWGVGYRDRSGDFRRFKTACAEGWDYFNLDEFRTDSFTILEDITIPGNMHVDAWNTKVIIPKETTLTVLGQLTGLRTDVEGTLLVAEDENRGGFFAANEKLTLNGEMIIQNADAEVWDHDLEGEVRNRVRLEGDRGGLGIVHEAGNTNNFQNMAAELAEHQENRVYHILMITEPVAITRDLTLAENVQVRVCGSTDFWHGSLTVPDPWTLTVNGGLLVWDATVSVEGKLENNNFIQLENQQGSGGYVGVLQLAGGTYAGGGVIRVQNPESPETSLIGFPDGQLTEIYRDEWAVEYSDLNDRFYRLKEACVNGSDYFYLGRNGTLIILEDLAIPDNLLVDAGEMAMTVPNGKTLTVRGELNCAELNLEPGSAVILRDRGSLYANRMPVFAGSLILADGSVADVPASAWATSGNLITVGKDACLYLFYDVRDDGALLSALEGVKVLADEEAAGTPLINILYDCRVSDLIVPKGTEMRIVNWNDAYAHGTLTVSDTLTVEGRLFVWDTDASACNIHLKDESMVLVASRSQQGRMGKLTLDGGSCYGTGALVVENLDAPQTYLPGFGDQIVEDSRTGREVIYRAKATTRDPVEAFVIRAYRLIQGREPDAEGLAYWTGSLKSGERGAVEVVSLFVNLEEYASKHVSSAEFVATMYRVMMGREPDQEGLNYWVSVLDSPCSYNSIIDGFLRSPQQEFQGICAEYGIKTGGVTIEARDQNPNLTKFIARNYKCALVREPDVDGLNWWASELLSRRQTPRDTAVAFVFSTECIGRGLNDSDFVEMLYGLFMGRASDAEGKAYWVDQLITGKMSRNAVVDWFAGSPEFTGIVANYGL